MSGKNRLNNSNEIFFVVEDIFFQNVKIFFHTAMKHVKYYSSVHVKVIYSHYTSEEASPLQF